MNFKQCWSGRQHCVVLWAFWVVVTFTPERSFAQVMKAPRAGGLAELSHLYEPFFLSPALEPISDVRGISPELDDAWASFELSHGAWSATIDSRSGRIESAEGVGIPWIPGPGNPLDSTEEGAPNLDGLAAIARRFVDQHSRLFGLASADLALNAGRSGRVADYLWFVDFDVTRAGVPIEGARVVFRVNQGNLIQLGLENVPPADVPLPMVGIEKGAAFQAVADAIGGFDSLDQILDSGSLHLLPVARRDSRFSEGFAFGQGYGLVRVWEVRFRRPGTPGTWRMRVDAASGQLLDFTDINRSAQATGGVILTTPAAGDTVRALPYADLSSGGFTNSGGLFTFSGFPTTSSLNGQYVTIDDKCGGIAAISNAAGSILFGSSGGTDCTTPGAGGAGNTRSARTQFYWLNRVKEIGRGWLPGNSWLNAKLVAEVNNPATCNAYWDGSKVRFFKALSPCNNTGEIPGAAIHEFGHGLDQNDGGGFSPDFGTGETIGDFTAAVAFRQSCVGAGFLNGNCGSYGDACTACTGLRDIDWAKHTTNTPHTVTNFTQTKCPQPHPLAPDYVGPCGVDAIARGVSANRREGHCESIISSEALWDFPNRDLPNPGNGAAWAVMDRLWYLSRATGTLGFTCNTSGAVWNSNGCNIGSLFRTLRAVDDDDGNLANGTPHGGALFAAFDRHGIACASDPGASTTFAGCTPPARPTITLTPGDNAANISWPSSGTGVVYDVYRNESGCNSGGFTKIANDVAATSHTDRAVANGTTYFYRVVAQPSGNEACSSLTANCQSVVPTAPPCVPPAAPTGPVAAAAGPAQINLSWLPAAGATEYHILRSATNGGPYSQVGTAATNFFTDTALGCNTAFFYVVRAANSTACESGNSPQVTAITGACTGSQVATFSAAPKAVIPDNNSTGITSAIVVTLAQAITSVSVHVDITHTFQGDLEVALIGPDNTTVLLHNRTGAGADDLDTTYNITTRSAQPLTAFTGKSTAGTWRLRVRDLAATDGGKLNAWRVTFNGSAVQAVNGVIPDNDATGLTSTINIPSHGTIVSLRVRADITHSYQGDLEVALIGPDNTTVLLHNRTGDSIQDIKTVYPDLTVPAQSLAAFTGRSTAGAWKLRVRDLAAEDTGTLGSWEIDLQTARFSDVPPSYWAWAWIEALAAAGITSGCGAGNYCPTAILNRAQMAVFLVTAAHGSGFVPPPATGTRFADVPATSFAASHIEQLAVDGVTAGCGGTPPRYCPANQVTRAQMAVFLLRAKHGPTYTPPPATGTVFSDVPAGAFAASWIERLAAEGISTGCGGGRYCPNAPVSRDAMAVFLGTAFDLLP